MLALLGGTALAVALFWPLALHMTRDVPKDLGDSLLIAQLIGWQGHALLHQPLDWWQWNAFFPNQDSLAFSDAPLGLMPLALLGSGVKAAIWHYDVAFLLAYGLAFAGAYLLARELGLRPAAAAVAGVAFAYSPWRWEQSAHLHVIFSGAIPLCLALLLRGYRRDSPRAVVGGWLVAAWQVLLGVSLGLQLVYLLAVLAAVALALWWRAGRPRPAPAVLRASAVGLLAFAIVLVVVARPYLRVAHDYPESRRSLDVVAYFSPPPSAFLAAPADNLVWGGVTSGLRDRLRAPAEQTLFPGALELALAVLGVVAGPWPRRLRIGLAVAIVVAAAFSLGLELLDGRVTYRLLYDLAPGWQGSRTPGRLHTLTTLGLALLAAAGAQAFVKDLRRGGLVCGLLAVVVLAEGSAHGSGSPAHPTVPPPPAGLSRAAPPLVQLPMDDPRTSADDTRTYVYMLWTADGFPELVNGISGFAPRRTLALRQQILGFPDARSVAALRAAGVRTVVMHRALLRGTPWEGAADRTIAGVSRRVAGDLVLFDLS